ncbi:transcription factor IIIB [Perilla frutescens var. hirtella]|uniref:Transcription factor IIIB n=1 Tax=Perilla frutescens var. hirtella TaxID=608512 RepID=A0AAD4P866_PERFH|nr:transcription factor IIIB [Perilla frutescens var. hirtella]
MDKVREFFKKTMFYAKVLSGYEERRIRSYRLQLQQRLQQAEARKAALNKVPEQIILSEVRKMVQDMQAMNKKLEETETAIEEYFKPIDKEAELIMKEQLKGEEKSMREMMAIMQRQALLEKAEAEAEALANSQNAKTDQHVEEPELSDKNVRKG